jgi:hypothetical protein
MGLVSCCSIDDRRVAQPRLLLRPLPLDALRPPRIGLPSRQQLLAARPPPGPDRRLLQLVGAPNDKPSLLMRRHRGLRGKQEDGRKEMEGGRAGGMEEHES